MIENWKPIGAFIENTIRPLIEEMKWLLQELDHLGVKITERNIISITDRIFKRAMRLAIISLIQNVSIAAIIGYVLCRTYR